MVRRFHSDIVKWHLLCRNVDHFVIGQTCLFGRSAWHCWKMYWSFQIIVSRAVPQPHTELSEGRDDMEYIMISNYNACWCACYSSWVGTALHCLCLITVMSHRIASNHHHHSQPGIRKIYGKEFLMNCMIALGLHAVDRDAIKS